MIARIGEDRLLYIGSVTGKRDGWVPFEWVEPVHGPSKEGEIQVIRDVGATGTLMCGLWRTGMTSPARNADGSSEVKYSAPLGDETFILLEGEAVLTVTPTGQEYPIKAGDIIGHPKHLDLLWSIKTPFLKKIWVINHAQYPAIKKSFFKARTELSRWYIEHPSH